MLHLLSKPKVNHHYVNGSQNLDAISSLPDDILVYMLSFMEMKIAARTSLLSKRWRYVWTHQTDLDFEDPAFFLIRKRAIWKHKDMSDKYFKWITQVLTTNRAQFLNSIKVHFPFDGFYAADIDKWVEIALSKKVRNLELNLSIWSGHALANPYKFRHDNLFKYPNTNLKSLHLDALSVEGTVVENISSYCPNLECLILRTCHFYFPQMAGVLPKNNLVISSSKMKHFELTYCQGIKLLQISCPKLTSLIIVEWNMEVVYANVPALVSVTIGEAYCYEIFHDLRLFSKISSQLHQLSLNCNLKFSFPTIFPAFPNVKQLDIMVCHSAENDDNLLALISFIEACPVLHTFKLKLQPRDAQIGSLMSAQNDSHQFNAPRAHKHLKVVEFIGFFENAFVAKLALCLTKNASMLEKIIFDPRCPQLMGNFHNLVDIEVADQIGLWRRQAKMFAKQIRVGVDVVIL